MWNITIICIQLIMFGVPNNFFSLLELESNLYVLGKHYHDWPTSSFLSFLPLSPASLTIVLTQDLTKLPKLDLNSLCKLDDRFIGQVFLFIYLVLHIHLVCPSAFHIAVPHSFAMLPWTYPSLVLHDCKAHPPLTQPEGLPRRLILRLWLLGSETQSKLYCLPSISLTHWFSSPFFLSFSELLCVGPVECFINAMPASCIHAGS